MIAVGQGEDHVYVAIVRIVERGVLVDRNPWPLFSIVGFVLFVLSIHEVPGHLHVDDDGEFVIKIDEDMLRAAANPDYLFSNRILFEVGEITAIFDRVFGKSC